MTRNAFLQTTLLTGFSALALPGSTHAATFQDPGLDIKTVEEFVRAGHSDLPKVKEMLVAHPTLLYVKYDWGNGDYESALEGAGHLGREDIADYLIRQGARANIFVLTMLGKTKLVKQLLKEYPSQLNALGAHGFTLLHHAKVGGERSKKLYEYLQKSGLTETKKTLGEA